MAYLSDIIVESYKEWENGFVFLKARTGCGKTTFVLNVLTQHAIKNGKRILYLVNRIILKQQLMSLLENPHLQAYRAELEENYQKYCNDEYDTETFEAKAIIMKNSKDFNGINTDSEVMKIAGISRNSYYKYKAELKMTAEN